MKTNIFLFLFVMYAIIFNDLFIDNVADVFGWLAHEKECTACLIAEIAACVLMYRLIFCIKNNSDENENENKSK